jgi:hypothetical protein
LAFLRFSRDKRGVESFALVHTTNNRRGKVRPRVLYWFRSPPDVKVGREPFDPAVRRALEAQNPDITFDWRAIVETPIPSADADKWRERRRAERAAKHAAAAEEEPEDAPPEEPPAGVAASASPDVVVAQQSAAMSPAAVSSAPASSRGGDANGKRRRRRRGPSGRGPAPSAPPPSNTEPSGD